MLKPCPSRWYYFAEFLVVMGILLFAYYLVFYQGLVPCALCEVQQLIYAFLGILFLSSMALPLKKWPQVLINGLLSLVALTGIVFSGRQVWLQYLPSQYSSGSCDVSLWYMVQIMPLSGVLDTILAGGAECAQLSWKFLGLSLAAWSFIGFISFFLLALWQGLGWFFSRR